jgi:hypothetical protein
MEQIKHILEHRLPPLFNSGLVVLALASGVYTYLGASELLVGERAIPAAMTFAIAVTIGLYLFWRALFEVAPQLTGVVARVRLFIYVLLGGCAAVMMSSWLNATALAGAAAIDQHLAHYTQQAQRSFDDAHRAALGPQNLQRDLLQVAGRFDRLAEGEEVNGTLTGAPGVGTVTVFLRQSADQFRFLADQVAQGAPLVVELSDRGSELINYLRMAAAFPAPPQDKVDHFGEAAQRLTVVMAELAETTGTDSVARALQNAKAFVRPAETGRGVTRQRQREAVQQVQVFVSGQVAILEQAIAEYQNDVRLDEFEPLSSSKAVMRYWRDFAPSWAGAIAIDLLPIVLLGVLVTAHGWVRRQERVALRRQRKLEAR